MNFAYFQRGYQGLWRNPSKIDWKIVLKLTKVSPKLMKIWCWILQDTSNNALRWCQNFCGIFHNSYRAYWALQCTQFWYKAIEYPVLAALFQAFYSTDLYNFDFVYSRDMYQDILWVSCINIVYIKRNKALNFANFQRGFQGLWRNSSNIGCQIVLKLT